VAEGRVSREKIPRREFQASPRDTAAATFPDISIIQLMYLLSRAARLPAGQNQKHEKQPHAPKGASGSGQNPKTCNSTPCTRKGGTGSTSRQTRTRWGRQGQGRMLSAQSSPVGAPPE